MERNSAMINDKPIENLPRAEVTRLFCTPDLHEVAFLLARDVRPVKIQYNGKYRFYFERNSKLNADLLDFHANAQVGIRDFISAIYSAKRMMREEDANHR
jgi:hypothetical protein